MIHPDDWEPADGLTLEPNAYLAAIEQEDCLALTAGPGAGKTEMLAQRADFLLKTGLCRYPKRILAISFKVDASQNLKSRVKKRCGPSMASRFDSYTFHAFAKKIIDRFRPVLTGVNQLDSDYQIGDQRIARKQITFSELVPFAIEILQQSDIARNAVRKTYSDVFLDEFQDCTNHQYSLIKAAFENTDIRLVAVGDTKQRIMGWAGALEGIFTNFATDFSARPLNLYRNFRSKPTLLRLQNRIISILDEGSAVDENDLPGEEGEVDVLYYENCDQEAAGLADQIESWISNSDYKPSEIAILVSKQSNLISYKLMENLSARGIAYRNEQDLQDISSEPAARLIIDYLMVLHGARNPDAYTRLMDFLVQFYLDEEEQYASQTDWKKFLQAERKSSRHIKKDDKYMVSIWESVKRLSKKLGKGRLASLSVDYEQGNRLNEVVRDTKEKIATLLSETGDIVETLKLFSDDAAVRIMTIHKSKGLEFDAVIIQGIENEIFWGSDEEERCVFFVGVSRAKDKLVLTHVGQRQKPNGANNRWRVQRTPKAEYIGYAENI